jgi:hypothetical protein
MKWRNREAMLAGDTLSFWCFSPEQLPAARLPRVQLKDSSGNFTSPLTLDRLTPSIPGGRWVQVKLPLDRFSTASLNPFDARRTQSIFFIQGAADETEHTLIIDEVKIDYRRPGDQAPPAAPKGLVAKGSDRHLDLSWQPQPPLGIDLEALYVQSGDSPRARPNRVQARPREIELCICC